MKNQVLPLGKRIGGEFGAFVDGLMEASPSLVETERQTSARYTASVLLCKMVGCELPHEAFDRLISAKVPRLTRIKPERLMAILSGSTDERPLQMDELDQIMKALGLEIQFERIAMDA